MKRFLIPLTLLHVLFLGCSFTSSQRAQENTQQSFDQQLRLNLPSDPSTLDPRKGGDLTSCLFHFLLFDGLTRLDDEGQVSLSLAEKINISEDQKVYTFHLKDAKWSDGQPITASDFERSWKAILDPDFPSTNAHLLFPIKNAKRAKAGLCPLSDVMVTSLDFKTLRVELAFPTPYFLELTAFSTFYPIAPPTTSPSDRSASSHPICSGPFCLEKWKRGDTLVLKRNPLFHKANEIALERIQFYCIDSAMTSLHMFEKGEIDILGQPLIPIPSDAICDLLEKGLLSIYPIPATTFCSFNVNQYPFNSLDIRKAFSYAIEREAITQNITQLGEEPAMGVIPPILNPYKERRYSEKSSPNDRGEKARLHLQKGCEELGISIEEFPQVTYIYPLSDLDRNIAQLLQDNWHKTLGVQVKIEGKEKKILMDQLILGRYQIGQSFWMAQYRDPMNIFERFQYKTNEKNYPNWENDQYIQLLDLSSKAQGKQERFAYLDQAEEILMEKMPIAPIFHWNAAYIVQPWVKSFGKASIGNGFFDRIYIDIEAKSRRD